ncbi:hypothetical protein Tco_0627330 [Tanacetum coccineum]|uniref:Uncharacterized protein n=1 Tax=Tanacetum coccineum TaxID=301880 RepID=A0ABQ4WM75_9ASTR
MLQSPPVRRALSQGSRCNILRGCGFCEEVRILFSELIFAFPRELWTSLGFKKTLPRGVRRDHKRLCDGLGVWGEQGKAKLGLGVGRKGYDPDAEGKFIATMQALKDLKYPLIDELEKLRDAPTDLEIEIMEAGNKLLHLPSSSADVITILLKGSGDFGHKGKKK